MQLILLLGVISCFFRAGQCYPLNSLPLPFIDEAAACWSQSHDSEPPVGTGACKQKSWDAPRASATAKHLLVNAKDDEDRARLLAASSGAWLRALPVSGLGLRLDDASVRIAVGLRQAHQSVANIYASIVGPLWMSWEDMHYVTNVVEGVIIAMLP